MNSHRLIISQALVTKDFESTQRYTHERAAEYQLFWQLTRYMKHAIGWKGSKAPVFARARGL